jgi:hypothetical protein
MIRKIKAQSAMEYLMTYGWAILIIAVVLGALFSLGVFNGSSLTATACIASSGYVCKSPIFDTNGNMSFTFGQLTGKPMYNVGVACAGSATPTGLPNPSPTSGSAAMVYLLANSFPSSIPSSSGTYAGNVIFANTLTIANGGTISVTSLNCYGASGSDISNVARGTSFSGGIWINYTANNAAPTVSGGTNPFLTVKIATISAKVT